MACDFSTQTSRFETSSNFTEVSPGTVCYWCYPTAISGHRCMGTDTVWESRFSGSKILHDYAQNAQPSSPTTLSVNTLYHFAFVFDGTDKAIYIDGVEDVSGTYSHGTVGSDTHLSIGSSTWSTSQGMTGRLEDVRVYDRALSAQEIEAIYTARGRDSIIEGLVHWWKLDEGAPSANVTSIVDQVGDVNLSSQSTAPTGHDNNNLLRRRV